MIQQTIPLYPNRDDVTLTSYVLEARPKMKGQEKLPAVLICPGGAYLYTSIREGEPIALAFNQMGYHAFVLDYSTYFRHKEKIDYDKPIEVRPEIQFPAPMIEIAMALRLIGQHAREWKVDMDKLGLAGFSAGAHNVAMFGNQFEESHIQFPEDIELEAIKPAFMILAYGLFDLVKAKILAQAHPQGQKLAQTMTLATMGQAQVDQNTLREWSPVHHINASTPPVFIWATGEDETVAASDSIEYALAMYQAARPCELHLYQKGPHGLSTAGPASAGESHQLNPHVATWLPLVEEWLSQLLA